MVNEGVRRASDKPTLPTTLRAKRVHITREHNRQKYSFNFGTMKTILAFAALALALAAALEGGMITGVRGGKSDSVKDTLLESDGGAAIGVKNVASDEVGAFHRVKMILSF